MLVLKDAIFTFRNPKNNFIYEEGNDVFNVVGDAPTVKGVFSFFIKEETVYYENCNGLFWKHGL